MSRPDHTSGTPRGARRHFGQMEWLKSMAHIRCPGDPPDRGATDDSSADFFLGLVIIGTWNTINGGVPQKRWMVFVGETSTKMDDFRKPAYIR